MDLNTDIKFVQAQPNDWSIIHSIAHRTWPATYGDLIGPDQLQYMLDYIYSESALKEQMEKMNHVFTLVYKDGSLVGFVSVEENYQSSEQLMIHKLYVLPELQGQGFGKVILNYICSKAKETGHSSVRLKVFFKNKKAIFFYKHFGFLIQSEEETKFENGYRILDYVMVKDICD